MEVCVVSSLQRLSALMPLFLGQREANAYVRSTTGTSIYQHVFPADRVCADGGWGSFASDCQIGEDCEECGVRMDASMPATERCTPERPPIGVAWCEQSLEFVTDDSATGWGPVETRNEVPSSNRRLRGGTSAKSTSSAVDPSGQIITVDEHTSRVESGVEVCGWPSNSFGPGAVGVTLVPFDPVSSGIFDADILLNADACALVLNSDGDPNVSVGDVENTPSHELEYALGLDHCHDSSALGLTSCGTETMRESTRFNETDMRTPSQDDIAGVSYLYSSRHRTPGGVECESKGRRGCSSGRHPHGYPWNFVIAALMRRCR